MIYEVKFNNGFWKVFNTFTYTDVGIFPLKTEADAFAEQLNAKKSKNKESK